MRKINWPNLFGKKAPEKRQPPQIQDTSPQGHMTAWFRDFHLRKVSGEFYEILREGIPIIDAGIRRLISLNGIIKIIGDKAPIVRELEDFSLNVPVNDMQKGLQAFNENFANETFEQGFAISEYVPTKDLKDIEGLRIADSKHIVFRKNKGGKAEPWYRYPGTMPTRKYNLPGSVIQQILNATYGQQVYINGMYEEKLNMANKLYWSINNENTDPHGVSIMRSLEFTSQILATIDNSMKSVFERHGDPSYHIHVKTTGGKEDLESRRQSVQNDFNTLLKAKRQGKNADLVTAGDANSSVDVKVVGADNKIVTFNKIPIEHLEQQFVAKFNLPGWMLGIYKAVGERMASAEVELALQDAKIRQLAMTPEILRLLSFYLTLKGHKWNSITTSTETPGDWGIVWETPNIRDILAIANANFLNAQAAMMSSESVINLNSGGQASVDVGSIQFKVPLVGSRHKAGCSCKGCKETRPDPWPEIERIEADYEKELKYDWAELEIKTFDLLNLEHEKSSKQEIPDIEEFTFSSEQRTAIMKSLDGFIGLYDFSDSDSAVRWFYGQAYSAGLIKAAYLIGQERPMLDIIRNKETFEEIGRSGFQLVRDNAKKKIVDEVIPAIEAKVTAGANPNQVGQMLKKLFGNKNRDWERLARTEITMAGERAKLDEWKQWDVKMVEFSVAPDACPICQGIKGDYEISKCPVPGADTHPRCRCAIRPAASEVEA